MEQSKKIYLPRDNVNDDYVTIISKKFDDGDEVRQGDIIIEYETSKAVVEFESEYSGFVKYLCWEGDELKPGDLIIEIFDHQIKMERTGNSEERISEKNNGDVIVCTRFSKEALRIIEKLGIDKGIFADQSFVTKKELDKYLNSNKTNGIISNRDSDQEKSNFEDSNSVNEYFVEKLGTNKKREINYLSKIHKEGLVSTIYKQIHIDNLSNWYNHDSKYFPESLLPTVLFESSRLLAKYRDLNSFFDECEIKIYKNINIGFGIDLEYGLKSLTVYNADKKNFQQIENEIYELSNRYLNDDLKNTDLTNSTFTITDLSGEGASFFAPIINYKQAAILGIGKFENILTLVLTFDHRVNSGKNVSRFLSELASRLKVHFDTKVINQIHCSKCLLSLEEESRLTNVGFVKILNKKGKEEYLCSNCFMGI
jgi:pyruvate/2-oxoglutarate dehydrogenase complex dihydrolipoamide acyltransferase (E2) component